MSRWRCGNRSFLIAGLVFALAHQPALGQKSTVDRFYFTAHSEEKIPSVEPMSAFDCSEMIYSVAHFGSLERGRYDFEVVWNDPTGKQREKTEFSFHTLGGEKRVWAWIKLHRPTGSSFFSFFDPTAGMEDFIGQWKILFRLNGKKVAQKSFTVDC